MSPKKHQDNEPIIEGDVVDNQFIDPTLKQALMLAPDKNKGGVFIGTLNLMTAPVKAAVRPFHHHYKHKYHGRYTHAKKLFVFDLFLVGIALALMATSIFFFFYKPGKNYLAVSLDQKNPILLGQTSDFNFTITNTTNSSLTDTFLTFEFPDTFILKDAPANFNHQNDTILLGTVKPKETINIDFRGRLWGALYERQKITLHSRFTEEKNQTAAEQISTIDVGANQSVFQTDTTLLEKIKVGQNINIIINYKNLSNEDKLDKVIIIPAWPNDFVITSANSELKDGRFILTNLAPAGSGQIKLSGYLRSQPSPNESNIKIQNFLEFNNKQYLQSSILKNLTVAPSDLALNFRLVSDKTFLKTDTDSAVEVAFKNNSSQTIKNATLELGVLENLLDKIPLIKLTDLEPKQEGKITIPFRLATITNIPAALESNFIVELRPTASFTLANEPTEVLRAFSAPQNFKVSTVLQLHAEGRYFTEDGDQLGRGPLPPRVSQTTKYWISWFITTAPNPIKNLQITGTLPPGVAWTDKTNVTEGEPVKYDPVTRQISWKSDSIQTTPGLTCPCSGIGFEVAITPTENDIGKILTLVNNLRFTATDVHTEEYIQKTVPDVTTNLTRDSMAAGKGQVKP